MGGRGGGRRRAVAVGGGGGGLLKGGGVIGVLVVVATIFLPQLLGGGAGQTFGLGGERLPSEQTTGGDEETCSSEAEQILCGATIDVQEYWIEQYPAAFDGLRVPADPDRVLLGIHEHRMWAGVGADRAVLLPGRQPRVLRSGLPRQAAIELRGRG